jgi:hypothetical protein
MSSAPKPFSRADMSHVMPSPLNEPISSERMKKRTRKMDKPESRQIVGKANAMSAAPAEELSPSS